MSLRRRKARPETLESTAVWRLSRQLESDPQVRTWLAELDQLVDGAGTSTARKRGYWLVAAAVACLALGGFLLINRPVHYATAVGEQRDVVLADGSRLTLNTASEATVRMTSWERRVQLLRGEVVFEVAHDARRPFDVFVGRSVVRALGTRFNIEVLHDGASVAILDGAVQIRTNTYDSTVEVPSVSRGESVSLGGSAAVTVLSPTELRRIAAWQDRKIEFADLPLPAAIAEYNRYSAHPFVIDLESAERVKLSGVFRIGDVAAFRYALEHSFGLRVAESSGRYVVSRP